MIKICLNIGNKNKKIIYILVYNDSMSHSKHVHYADIAQGISKHGQTARSTFASVYVMVFISQIRYLCIYLFISSP